MNSSIKKNIVISGGGTGGHLFPALAICEPELNNYNFIYIGSIFGIESRYYKKSKFPKDWNIHLLDIKGIHRGINISNFLKNISFPYKFIKSYFYTKSIIKSTKPKIIIGTGGYSSGIPLLVGIQLGIPTLIQEQNSIPGLVTKKLHNKVSKICSSYEKSNETIKTNNVVLTGNPISKKIKKIDKNIAKKQLNINKNKKVILFLGGSQGALPINNHLISNVEFYSNNKYQIILQCGHNNYNKIPDYIKNNKQFIIKKFFNDMSCIYNAADIVIARAGALTISELSFLGKTMILIPYKYAADNHQYLNAIELAEKNACILIHQDNLKTGILEKKVLELFNNNDQIKDLEKNALKYSYPKATENIWKEIRNLL